VAGRGKRASGLTTQRGTWLPVRDTGGVLRPLFVAQAFVAQAFVARAS
jgi:hypothetical protein